MHKIWSTFVLLSALGILPSSALASLISPSDFGALFEVFNPAPSTSNVLYSYDAVTDVFSLGGTLGTVASPAVLDAFPLASPFDVTDLVGTFSLTATVDSSGSTLGGSFSWIGQSAALGIAADTTLVAGTIGSVEYLPGSPIGGFQFISSIESLDAQIAALYGDVDSALIYCSVCPGGVGFDLNPWNVDIGPSRPSTQTPSIYGSSTKVSEANALVLVAVGLLALGFAQGRRGVDVAPDWQS